MKAVVALSFTVAAAVTVLAGPRPAAACSHACQQGKPELVAPTNESIDAPLNTVVSLRWTDADLVFAPARLVAFVLRGPDGAAVPAEVVNLGWASTRMAAVELHPLAPLAPDTHYVVSYEIDGYPDEPTGPVGSFTTGTALDDTPPELLSLGAPFELGDTDSCFSHSVPACCYNDAPVRKRDLFATWPDGATEPVTFNLREGSAVVALGLRRGRDPDVVGTVNCDQAYIDCGYGDFQPFVLPVGSHVLTVSLQDRAGHETVLGDVTVDAVCPAAPAPDAGTRGDGGSEADASVPPGASGGDSGCACRVGRRPGGDPRRSGPLATGLLGLVVCAFALRYRIARTTPPSTRSAAPVVADAGTPQT